MFLTDKVALVYGAGGSVGGAVARTFAREGAHVHLAGRRQAPLDTVAADICANGGRAEVATVDAADEQAVEAHTAELLERAGRIDVLFNAIGMQDVQGTPLTEMPLESFSQPVEVAARTQFLTARAVGRRMAQQGNGVLLTITAEPTPVENLGGFGAACGAIEGLWRGLAVELGPHGVRANVIRSAGSPDAAGVQATMGLHAGDTPLEQLAREVGSDTPLGRAALLAEVADVAAMLASDRASAMTAALVNVTCGAHIDV
jgi:NAD(P)-dependent dehydrogenase (short-subunit alcohol dehydrogenase family)